VDAKLDDNVSKHLVDVFYDNTFGAWMFVDPDAEFGPEFFVPHPGERLTQP
jgi:hypothetical protein